MNSKSFNSNTKPTSINFPAPVSIKVNQNNVRFIGQGGDEEIILNTDMPLNDLSQIKDRIVSITYNCLSQFFKVVKVIEWRSGSTVTAKPLENASISQLWRNKIKGEFFYLVETARNILPEPNKLKFEFAIDPLVDHSRELDRVVEVLRKKIPEQNVTVKTLVDALPEGQVTDIAAIAETPAFKAKSYVFNNMNIFTNVKDGGKVITLTGKTITLGLTHDDTTQQCSQDALPKIFDDLDNVNKGGGYVSLSVINEGKLMIDSNKVEEINKVDCGKNGLYYNLTMANGESSNMNISTPTQPQTPQRSTICTSYIHGFGCG
jgi:hypothetical protein